MIDYKNYKAKKDHSAKYMVAVIILIILGSSDILATDYTVTTTTETKEVCVTYGEARKRGLTKDMPTHPRHTRHPEGKVISEIITPLMDLPDLKDTHAPYVGDKNLHQLGIAKAHQDMFCYEETMTFKVYKRKQTTEQWMIDVQEEYARTGTIRTKANRRTWENKTK